MDAATLILIAPCSLLLGAVLQLLLAGSLRPSKRHFGLSHLPPRHRRRHRHRSRVAQRAIHRSASAPVGWAIGTRPSCGRAQRSLCLHGRRHRRPGAALFHRLHGARQVGHALLRHHVRLHRRLHHAGLQRQPIRLLSLLGSGRTVLIQSGRFLVHQSRSGGRRAQGAADDAHRGLRPAGRDHRDLSPRRQRPLDRSRRGAQLHWRHLRADAGCARRQERAGSAAHLDSRSNGRAHSGERAAARRLLCDCRRLSGRAHAQFWRLARAGARAWCGSAP